MILAPESNRLVLFQGDSITDTGRNRDDDCDMGRGYAMMAAAWYESMFPERMVQFVNRGVSGNTVNDLEVRWREDCLRLRPALVSILIGINDTARCYDARLSQTVDEFERIYRGLLEETKDALEARLVLMEPFLLDCPTDRRPWRSHLDPRIEVVRRLAREFKAALVPLDGLFAQASARREPAYWAQDGVHPTPPGHALIARAWLSVVRGAESRTSDD